MSKERQDQFLTWGIFFTVFLIRFILPFIIATLVSGLNLIEEMVLVLEYPNEYSSHLVQAEASVSAFDGMFLLLVFLSFTFNQQRHIHWLGRIEHRLNQMGLLKLIEILLAFIILLVTLCFVLDNQKIHVFIAGTLGIIFFIFLNNVTELITKNKNRKLIKQASIMNFLYLEILDASFSFDGIVGSFSLSKNIFFILLGLAIGVTFLLSLTIILSHKGILDKYRFLELGSHYAMGVLGIIMLISIVAHIPEIVTGLIGVSFTVSKLLASHFSKFHLPYLYGRRGLETMLHIIPKVNARVTIGPMLALNLHPRDLP